jgi:hypothetical protein
MIGQLVAAEPGIQYATLYSKQLEIEKDSALKANRGDYDARMVLSPAAKNHLHWWTVNAPGANKSLRQTNPQITIQSDSSDFGWGAHVLGRSAGGAWTLPEADRHINEKELHAVLLALQCFAKNLQDVHIRLEIDNTTAVSYIQKQGGRKQYLYNLALQIWEFAIERNIWLTAAHLPGALNTEADAASRNIAKYDKEWQLAPEVFQYIQHKLGSNQVDLFASRVNSQLPKYVAWQPDPGAIAIDAFTLNWRDFNSYIFPPFSCLGKVVQKMRQDGGRGTIVAPVWPTQHWHSALLSMTTEQPLLLRHHQLLRLPHRPGATHPLLPKLKLAAYKVSGTT